MISYYIAFDYSLCYTHKHTYTHTGLFKNRIIPIGCDIVRNDIEIYMTLKWLASVWSTRYIDKHVCGPAIAVKHFCEYYGLNDKKNDNIGEEGRERKNTNWCDPNILTHPQSHPHSIPPLKLS